jgi:hypothetical protein
MFSSRAFGGRKSRLIIHFEGRLSREKNHSSAEGRPCEGSVYIGDHKVSCLRRGWVSRSPLKSKTRHDLGLASPRRLLNLWLDHLRIRAFGIWPSRKGAIDVSQGDFFQVSPQTVHRDINPSPDEGQEAALFLPGSGPVVVNMDGSSEA